MSLFKRKKKLPEFRYDPQTQQAAVLRSICTGEMTVGFIDRASGRFSDLMKVEDQAALEEFMAQIGVDEIKSIY